MFDIAERQTGQEHSKTSNWNVELDNSFFLHRAKREWREQLIWTPLRKGGSSNRECFVPQCFHFSYNRLLKNYSFICILVPVCVSRCQLTSTATYTGIVLTPHRENECKCATAKKHRALEYSIRNYDHDMQYIHEPSYMLGPSPC